MGGKNVSNNTMSPPVTFNFSSQCRALLRKVFLFGSEIKGARAY